MKIEPLKDCADCKGTGIRVAGDPPKYWSEATRQLEVVPVPLMHLWSSDLGPGGPVQLSLCSCLRVLELKS